MNSINRLTHEDIKALNSVILVRPLDDSEVNALAEGTEGSRVITIPKDQILAPGEEWGEIVDVGPGTPEDPTDRTLVGKRVIFRSYNALEVLSGKVSSVSVDDLVAVFCAAD